MTENPEERAAFFEAQAKRVEARAARVMRLAAHARLPAEGEAANGDPVHQGFRVREAQTHESSAAVLRKTAALYRVRARELRPRPGPHEP